MSTPKTIYISIGNSDDKLTQARWAQFCSEVDGLIRFSAINMGIPVVHGYWQSLPNSPWQNACWCVELTPELERRVRNNLRYIAAHYDQDSIAWAEATTEFITPPPAAPSTPEEPERQAIEDAAREEAREVYP